MKKALLLALLVLTCAATRQDSHLSEMKEELKSAQKKLVQQKAHVEHLQEEIARHEIALIQKEIALVDTVALQILSEDEWFTFFKQQREILNRIIRSNLSCSAHAQEVLDKILTLITQVSDQTCQ